MATTCTGQPLDNSLVSLIRPSGNDSDALASNNTTIQDGPTFLMRGLLIGTTILLNGNEYDSGTADEETGQDYVCTFT
jgi:hypothetical protein